MARPIIHWLGSGFGQKGSTSKTGAETVEPLWAVAGCCRKDCPAVNAVIAKARLAPAANFIVFVMLPPLDRLAVQHIIMMS
jgi:hypothetical protein